MELSAVRGEMIAAALMAHGIKVHRYTTKAHEPREFTVELVNVQIV